MKRYDALVLGAGPAGTAMAALLAGAGAHVLLVERESFPREKVCGEFLSPEGVGVLARLGVLDALRGAGAAVMGACRVTDAGGREAVAVLPDIPNVGREALGVSRSLLDGTLLDLARRRGVEVRERVEATMPVLSSGRVIGMRIRPTASHVAGEAARARLVIAADGRRSALVRALHPRRGDPTRTTDRSWFGMKRHLAGSPERLGGRVELHVFRGGYAGLGAIEADRLNLCLITMVGALRACGGSPDRLLDERVRRNPAARAALDGIEPAGPWKTMGPLRFGARLPSAAGALFVGDAAGTVDPFCGEGMSNALRAAELALPAALEALARGRLEPDAAARYDRAWRAAFGPMTRRARALGWVLERPRASAAALGLLARGGGGLFRRVIAATRPGARRS